LFWLGAAASAGVVESQQLVVDLSHEQKIPDHTMPGYESIYLIQ
jgi:quercetin dioxygenase-like cupin family protein